MAENPLIALHQAFNARDEQAFRSLLAEDVVWHTPGNHPLAGTLTGRDEMWARYASRFSARIDDHAELSHPDHSQVAVLFTVVNEFGDGAVRLPGLEVARVRDGQVAERWEFEEDQALVDRIITQAAARAERVIGQLHSGPAQRRRPRHGPRGSRCSDTARGSGATATAGRRAPCRSRRRGRRRARR